MTPQQFLTHLKQREPGPAYLFLGPEPYQRDYCRKALIERALPDPEERENGLTRLDLEETTLEAAIGDACSLSLFTTRRTLVISNAEAALPRTKGAAAPEEEEKSRGTPAGAAALERYLQDPAPGVTLVFEAARFEFQGEDKKKIERVREFYRAVPEVVEFAPMTAAQARPFAAKLAERAGLEIGPAELDILVEALGAEAGRIATEIEKLRLYGKRIGEEEISKLVPEARESTIFALVAAMGRGDRAGSLDTLDTLIRQSEYLPLALSFLATQFRLALAAKEAGLRGSQQILGHFSKQGTPMWPARAEQVYQTVSKFSRGKLEAGLKTIYQADRSLRDARPDDRVVMEDLILRLTG